MEIVVPDIPEEQKREARQRLAEAVKGSGYVTIYPVYINRLMTLAQGRRIGKENCCDNPSIINIAECCARLQLPYVIEQRKRHPRDWAHWGRARVQLKKNDEYLNSELKSRKDLLKKMGEMIPKLESYQQQQLAMSRRVELADEEEEQKQTASPKSLSKSKKGKKGKKKGKKKK